MSNSANPFTPNQQSMLQGSRRGARPGSVPLGNASGSGVGADLVRSVGLQVAPTISGSNSQYSWASGASFNLRYWPEAVNSSIEKVPAARKGAKLAPIAGESSKCNQCKGRNDHSNTCAFGCITLGQIPTGACAECIAMGTSNRYDRTLFTSLREELGIVKGLEQQVELAVKHNYTLPEIGLLSQVQGIRERLSTLIATYSPDMAPEDATANDTPRKRKRAASDEVAIGGRMSHNFAAFGYRHDTRTGPRTPVRTDSGDESGSKVNLTRAVVDIRSEMTAPIWVFQGIVKAVKVGSVRIDHEGRAIVTRKKTRKNIGRKVIAQVERLLTYVWSRFIHIKVRLVVVTSLNCTLVFYVDDYCIQVSDLYKTNDGTMENPWILFVSEGDLDLPTGYLGGGVELHTLDPTRDLRFDKLSTMGELGRWGESMTSKACTIGENVTVKELGPPSLYVHIPKEYNFERVRRPDVGHSLLRARRWPNLLHGPVSYHLLTADLPILISPEISINKSCPFPTLRDSARSPSTIGVTEQSPLNHTSASPSCVFIPQSIVLGEPLSWGAMWDVFRITSPPDQPPLPFPMVAKIVAPEAFEVTPRPHFAPRFSDFVRGGTSQRQMRQSVKSELGVYTQLNNLTPPVIPRVLGLWGGTQRGQEVWVMIMEDAGEGLSQRGIQQLSEADKDAIRSLYRRIHQSGFLHGDVQNRHICRPKRSSDPTAFRLIDFDRGRLHGELSEEEWERELEKEKEAVESLLSQVYLSPTSSIAS
ncbi:hypothetical protein TREMEDRAFT_64026 [Tremella mesenterica DSM 1558]|uniref:uncharacterized protein n=1 Tax=Tremella mesenterica (strain ATCC 24925 / CBS 8224 / DSM 1558 / NBRC 9311 / NRRL Y-6157 / RJB 2259-6 / UBC 559-6) TaxID=578456 RepID=UPI0003F49DB7|nr:uncharacterized protein TREMEDRAFT_64026 [Tremella mesenterica DSM 1558]EIW68128.1 hypothetical protein TREMEDRAFT_64026 [Tremella mesenterica DSM 1558]